MFFTISRPSAQYEQGEFRMHVHTHARAHARTHTHTHMHTRTLTQHTHTHHVCIECIADLAHSLIKGMSSSK